MLLAEPSRVVKRQSGRLRTDVHDVSSAVTADGAVRRRVVVVAGEQERCGRRQRGLRFRTWGGWGYVLPNIFICAKHVL